MTVPANQLRLAEQRMIFQIKTSKYTYPNNLQLIVNADDENKLASFSLNFHAQIHKSHQAL